MPLNLTYAWNFGSLLGTFIALQIITGIFLAMHYSPRATQAFDSIVLITRNIRYMWLIRSLHINGASLVFLFSYIHIFRGIWFGGFQHLHVWYSGITIFILLIGAAFTGYILVWGQLRFWAATVITSILTALPYGGALLTWIWGGFAVGAPTLNRIFVLHFIIPLIVAILALVHIYFLHKVGSSNPLGVDGQLCSIPFYPYYVWKDIFGLCLALLLLLTLSTLAPNLLTEPDNYIPANPLQTPTHIKPEWYFLWLYAILRAIPHKLGGIIALVLRLIAFFLYPLIQKQALKALHWRYDCAQALLILLMGSWVFLSVVGAQPADDFWNWQALKGTAFFLPTFYFSIPAAVKAIDKIRKL